MKFIFLALGILLASCGTQLLPFEFSRLKVAEEPIGQEVAVTCAIAHKSHHVWWRIWEATSKGFSNGEAFWIAPTHEFIKGRDYRTCSSFKGHAYYHTPFSLAKAACVNLEAIIDGNGSYKVIDLKTGAILTSKLLRHSRLNQHTHCLENGDFKVVTNHFKMGNGPTAGFVMSIVFAKSKKVIIATNSSTLTFITD